MAPMQSPGRSAQGAAQSTTITQPIVIPSSGTLRLRAGPPARSQEPVRRVQWAEDVVNNEDMGKKSSKVCCIYHKPREVGESSDESSDESSSSDGDSSDQDDGAAKPFSSSKANGSAKKPKSSHNCNHNHQHTSKKAPLPNAYEQQPKSTNK